MAVVVSDTTPLHYLILIDQVSVLQMLYGAVIIPHAVLAELSHLSAPDPIRLWSQNLPSWITVAEPVSVPPQFQGLDLGERQALALAHKLHAELVLLDDKFARRIALMESIRVKGTLGIIAEAAKANLLDFTVTLAKLQDTSMHLDQHLIDRISNEFKRSQQL